jgi:hypothetical protein
MATARGRWLRDQISARFGACVTWVGTGPSVTCAFWVSAVLLVVVDVDSGGVGGVGVPSCRAVLLKGAAAVVFDGVACFESWRAAAAATRRREAYIVSVWVVVVVVISWVGGFGTGTRT